MDIELLDGILEKQDSPGLDPLDERLMDIAGLAQQGDFSGAAEQSATVFEEKIYDIRISGYYFYGIFLEQGLSTVALIFRCIKLALEDNWEAFGPENKRKKHAYSGINWFFKQLTKKLQFEEDRRTENWNSWLETISGNDVQDMLDAADELQISVGMTLEEEAGTLPEGLTKASDWLISFQSLVYKAPEPEDDDEEIEEIENIEDIEIKAPVEIQTVSDPSASTFASGSSHLDRLMKKIDIFEKLIRAGHFPGAAIVYDDLNKIFANFDPKRYFPEILSKFYRLYAKNISMLSAFEDRKDTAEWQAMKEYYNMDIDGFIDIDM